MKKSISNFYRVWIILLILYIIFWILMELDYTNRGVRLIQKGEYARAIELLNKAIEDKPEEVLAYLNRGVAHFHLGYIEEAQSDFEQAVKVDPNYSPAYANRCGFFGNIGELEKALEDCNKAIDLEPNQSLAYSNRGLIYRQLGEFDLALADYDKALDDLPFGGQSELIYTQRSSVRRLKGDLEGAISDAEMAIEKNKNFALAYAARGLALMLLGKETEAQADFDHYLELDPKKRFYLNTEIDFAQRGEIPPLPIPEVEEVSENEQANKAEDVESVETAPMSISEYLIQPLPRYATLIFGGILLLIAFLITRTINQATNFRQNFLSHENQNQLQLLHSKLAIRRLIALIFGLGFIFLYFRGNYMPLFVAVIYGAFFLDTFGKIVQMKNLISSDFD